MGPELMERMKAQCERFGTVFSLDEIVSADLGGRPFVLTTSAGDTIEADAVVIATGASAKYLGLPNELRLRGHGVSACATCDGFFYQQQDVCVIGGGDSAVEEATFLTRFAKKVYMIHRRDTLRASKIMQKRAQDNDKIEILWNTQVADVLGKDEVTGVRLKSAIDGTERDLAVTGVFLGIGHTPNTKPFVGKLRMDGSGYLLTTPGSTHTSIPGVFAAGDVQDIVYRQAITAAGSGCAAALDCEHWLEDQAH
jgi:thioredoxin reductase (NADPH)